MNPVLQFRSFNTTISHRSTDRRIDDRPQNDCTHCRECVCKSCGRLYRPNISQEETIALFKKAA
jgi:hypothetical protein